MPELGIEAARSIGVWRWAWRAAKAHRLKFGVSLAVPSAILSVLGSSRLGIPLPIEIVVAAGGTVVLTVLAALLVAAVQQRDVLRQALTAYESQVDEDALRQVSIIVDPDDPASDDPCTVNVEVTFRNDAPVPMAYRMEYFSQKSGDRKGMFKVDGRDWRLAPHEDRVFRLYEAHTRLPVPSLHARLRVDVEYALTFWAVGTPFKFRRTYQGWLDVRPISDGLGKLISRENEVMSRTERLAIDGSG